MSNIDSRIQGNEQARLEFGILGAMINGGSKVCGPVFQKLSAEDFSFESLQDIFRGIHKLFNEGNPIDRTTVLYATGPAELYADKIQAATDWAVLPVNLDAHADILREKSRISQINSLGLELSGAKDMEESSEILSRLNSRMVSGRERSAVTMEDAYYSFADRHGTSQKPDYLDFGFPKLNRALYCEAGDMVIIAGEPSSGKTALALQMAWTLAEKRRVGLFTLETSPDKIMDRLMSHLTRIPMRKLKGNDITDPEWMSIIDTTKLLSHRQLEIIPAAGMTVSDIRSFALAKRYEVVLIDYMQIVKPGNMKASRYDQVTQISMELHTMAQESKISVIALAQLSRPEKGKQQPPTMHDLRDSGQIEQDADAILLIYRKDRNDNSGPRILKVGKNKEGQMLDFELDFDGEIQTFREAETSGKAPSVKRARPPQDAGMSNAEWMEIIYEGKEPF